MCGRELHDHGIMIKIEGTILEVCSSCAKFGTPVQSKANKPISEFTVKKKNSKKTSNITTKHRTPKKSRSTMRPEKVLIEGYGAIIRAARQKKKLSHLDLSRKIKEPVSLLQNIETEKIKPSDAVVEKLERELGITLLEEVTDFEYSPEPLSGNKKTTLGDIIVIKDKKKNKE